MGKVPAPAFLLCPMRLPCPVVAFPRDRRRFGKPIESRALFWQIACVGGCSLSPLCLWRAAEEGGRGGDPLYLLKKKKNKYHSHEVPMLLSFHPWIILCPMVPILGCLARADLPDAKRRGTLPTHPRRGDRSFDEGECEGGARSKRTMPG
jgi:hypothetical protein